MHLIGIEDASVLPEDSEALVDAFAVGTTTTAYAHALQHDGALGR